MTESVCISSCVPVSMTSSVGTPATQAKRASKLSSVGYMGKTGRLEGRRGMLTLELWPVLYVLD